MGMEHTTAAAMVRYAKYPKLFNRVVKKANKNSAFYGLLASAFTNEEVRKKLANPFFYARIIFGA